MSGGGEQLEREAVLTEQGNMTKRQTRRLQAWMVIQGVRQVEVARELGVSSEAVRRFLNGTSTSWPLYEYFTGTLGCPKGLFRGSRYDEAA